MNCGARIGQHTNSKGFIGWTHNNTAWEPSWFGCNVFIDRLVEKTSFLLIAIIIGCFDSLEI